MLSVRRSAHFDSYGVACLGVCTIFSGTAGYLDKLSVSDVGPFEEQFLNLMRTSHSDLLTTIRTEGQVSKETEEKMRSIIEGSLASYKQ